LSDISPNRTRFGGLEPPPFFNLQLRLGQPQGKHLQCVAETICHEKYHKYCDDHYSGSTDTDGDGLPDAEENTPSKGYFKVSDPTNPDTFNYNYGGGYEDQEVRCRLEEIHNCGAVYPSKDWSADPENSQW